MSRMQKISNNLQLPSSGLCSVGADKHGAIQYIPSIIPIKSSIKQIPSPLNPLNASNPVGPPIYLRLPANKTYNKIIRNLQSEKVHTNQCNDSIDTQNRNKLNLTNHQSNIQTDISTLNNVRLPYISSINSSKTSNISQTFPLNTNKQSESLSIASCQTVVPSTNMQPAQKLVDAVNSNHTPCLYPDLPPDITIDSVPTTPVKAADNKKGASPSKTELEFPGGDALIFTTLAQWKKDQTVNPLLALPNSRESTESPTIRPSKPPLPTKLFVGSIADSVKRRRRKQSKRNQRKRACPQYNQFDNDEDELLVSQLRKRRKVTAETASNGILALQEVECDESFVDNIILSDINTNVLDAAATKAAESEAVEEKVQINDDYECKTCTQKIAGSHLKCSICHITLHPKCANLLEGEHVFIDSFVCKSCTKIKVRTTYKCDVANCPCYDKAYKYRAVFIKHFIRHFESHRDSNFKSVFKYIQCNGHECNRIIKENGNNNMCSLCYNVHIFKSLNHSDDYNALQLNDDSANFSDGNVEEKQVVLDEESSGSLDENQLLEDVAKCNIYKTENFPEKHIVQIGQIFVSILRQCISKTTQNQILPWIKFFMLFKVFRQKPLRSGKKHIARIDATFKRKLQMFKDGNIWELWEETKKMQKKLEANMENKMNKISEQKRVENYKLSKCEKYLRLGYVKRANDVLKSHGIAKLTDYNKNKLKTKLKSGKVLTKIKSLRTVELVTNELRLNTLFIKLNKLASGGVNILNVKVLQQLWTIRNVIKLTAPLTKFINMVMNGNVPDVIGPHFWGVREVLLNKPIKKDAPVGTKPDIRPVGISDTLARLAESEACNINKSELNKHIDPAQIGIGVKGGAEGMIEMHRRAGWFMQHSRDFKPVTNPPSDDDIDMESEKDSEFYSLLQTDIENCFNSINNEEALKLYAKHVPNLYPLMYSMYKQPTKIYLADGTVLYHCNGGIQGRITSGYSLALIQYEIELKVKEKCKSYLNNYKINGRSYYIDDNGQLAKNIFNLIYLRVYNKIALQFGLNLKDNKTQLIIGKTLEELYDSIMSDIEFVNTLNIAGADKIDFSNLKILEKGSFEVMGVRIGSKKDVDNFMFDKITKWLKNLKMIQKLKSIHHQYILISNFYNINKINYLARNLSYYGVSKWQLKFDEIFIGIHNKIVGENMSNINIKHASISSKRGGLSMRTITQIQSAAFLSCNSSINTVLKRLLDNDLILFTNKKMQNMRDLAVNNFNSKVLPQYQIIEEGKLTQSELIDRIDKSYLSELYTVYDSRGKAALKSISNWKCDSWLKVNPAVGYGVDYDNVQFRLLMKRRLNMPIMKEEADCLLCTAKLDVYGDHGLNCSFGHGRIGRHNSMACAVMEICKGAGFKCELELNGLVEDSSKKPADIMVYNLFPQHHGALDVGITNIVSDSGSRNREIKLIKSAENRLVCADLYYATKTRKYEAIINNSELNYKYKPLIFESMGGINYESKQTLNYIIGAKCVDKNLDPDQQKCFIYRKLLGKLQKENAVAILEHYAQYFYFNDHH